MRQSMAGLHRLQTANMEMLERLGGTMDTVHRDGMLDSQHTPLTATRR
jgi:hypothetical protein